MKNKITCVLMSGLLLLGCVKSDDEAYEAVLSQMDRIGDLWTNDIQTAYHEIEMLQNSNPTSFFLNAKMCHKYVQFIEQLTIDAIPLDKRFFYVSRCFMLLLDPLYKSTKDHPENHAFLLMADAEYYNKLIREYPSICTQLEKESLLVNEESIKESVGQRVKMFASKEEYEKYRKQSAERNGRKRNVQTLKNYKHSLEYELRTYPEQWLDSEYRKELINLFPEPRRTELINYIERKIGRPMKWRSVGVH